MTELNEFFVVLDQNIIQNPIGWSIIISIIVATPIAIFIQITGTWVINKLI